MTDPYYGGGSYYEVIAYDSFSLTGTVLITFPGDMFTEVYMSRDQYGWLAYDDYTY